MSQGPGTYTYGYDIEEPATRNIQFRRERRLPNGTVTGSYGLVEPDGNVRIVHYTADNLGYRCVCILEFYNILLSQILDYSIGRVGHTINRF